MIDDFYACQGWDAAGVPLSATLRKYDIGEGEITG